MSSFENVKNFYEYLAKNKNLQKKLSSKVVKISDEGRAMTLITNIANKENFDFSVDELRQFIQTKTESLSAPSINDSQLASVAGGEKEFSCDVEE